MLSFLGGLLIGGIIAIFVYRNNKSTISKYADAVDKLSDKLFKAEKEVNDLTIVSDMSIEQNKGLVKELDTLKAVKADKPKRVYKKKIKK